MNKKMRFFVPFLIIILTIVSMAQASPVEAASKYAEGEHNLPFTVLKDSGDEQSMTNDYMISPAKLVVKDGKNLVQVTLKNSSWWQYFKVQSGGNFVDVTVLSEGNDTELVQFEVQDLDQILNAKIHVIVPDIDYDNKYDIRFKFNTSNLSANVAGEASSETTEKAAEKVDEKETSSNTEESSKPAPEENPKTSDNAPILLLSLALLASGFIVVRKVAFK